MTKPSHDDLRNLAHQLRRHGLATPALFVVDTLAPLGFIGEQALLAVGPLLPMHHWRDAAANIVRVMQDQHLRDDFRHMLADESEMPAR